MFEQQDYTAWCTEAHNATKINEDGEVEKMEEGSGFIVVDF